MLYLFFFQVTFTFNVVIGGTNDHAPRVTCQYLYNALVNGHSDTSVPLKDIAADGNCPSITVDERKKSLEVEYACPNLDKVLVRGNNRINNNFCCKCSYNLLQFYNKY